ncbi:MAG: hypothetical protein GTO22_19510 [Gemmatimonadales bacterium]|nr:hypothetical protein [Gemmatimonadales bacterium]
MPYSGDLDVLVGEYAGPARGRDLHMSVSRDGDQLVFTRRDQEEGQRPTHVGGGVWQAGGTRMWFDVAADRVVSLRIARGAGHYVLGRVGR